MIDASRIHIEIDIHSSVAQPVSVQRLESPVPSLSVPPKLRKGLAALGRLSGECYSTLFRALKDAAPADTAKDLAQRIEQEFPDYSRASIEGIIRSIDVAQSVQKSAHVEADEFASDVWEAIQSDEPKLLEEMDREVFQNRLSAMISQTDIQLATSKIKELRGETERHMCGGRIITDIRPAFLTDPTSPPAMMTIMHTLQIQYHDDSTKHREFYVSVNGDDLAILKKAIDRAIAKENTLKGMFDGTQFQFAE